MILTLLGRSCLSQQFFEKKRLDDNDDVDFFHSFML